MPVGRASPVTSRFDRPENRACPDLIGDRETEGSSRTCPTHSPGGTTGVYYTVDAH